jgi:hypothetical protein
MTSLKQLLIEDDRWNMFCRIWIWKFYTYPWMSSCDYTCDYNAHQYVHMVPNNVTHGIIKTIQNIFPIYVYIQLSN